MIKSIKFNKIILVSFLITSFFQSCTKSVDMIAFNGNIYTVDNDFSKASAFAINNGKFIEVGTDEILSKYKSKNILNLEGSTVLPGLIDAHCHFYGLGLNQSVLYPETPVILERIDGHAYLVNQKALDVAGIDVNTISNNGTVVIEKGELTGILIDGPMSFIDKAFGEISNQEKIDALLSAQEICFKNGLTTVDDAGLSKEIILLIDSLQKNHKLKMRIYAMISNTKNDVNYFIEKGPIKTELLNVRSVKVYGDGALGSRGATLKKPYTDDIHNHGKLVTDIQSIKELAKKLSDANFQMNTHAIGDSTINILLKAYSKVLENKKDPRWRIEHSQIVDLKDINGYNEKILPSVQPTHATSDMYWAEDRVGPKRIKGAYANKELLKRSKVIGLGTDFPVEKVNPFHTFYAATARKDLDNYPEGGFEFSNALSREETIKGMTIWAAYLNFEENEKGSIEKNKFADFIIIDRDIMKVDIDLTPNTKVLKTYLSGELVYSNTDSN